MNGMALFCQWIPGFLLLAVSPPVLVFDRGGESN